MKRAILLPFHKEWLDMIASGEKKFEFRNKIGKDFKEGMKVYLYIALGKELKCNCCHEGSGMIEAEFTIGEIVENAAAIFEEEDYFHHTFDFCSQEDFVKWGFNDQNYAIEIKDFKRYKTPISKDKFISWNKRKKMYDKKNMCIREEFCTGCIKGQKCFDEEWDDCPFVYVNSAPQSFVYVVEKEL